ncbi:cytochrome c oxidase subunit II [Vulgatibacter sp.]|uniref:cytochrome c oxidase subunit II n=1 Tax=Vulgatibacter sp. TaxID=1971226 RepID=UPI003567BAE4
MKRSLAIALLLQGCGGAMSALEPAGPYAARLESLWWFFFWITIVPAAVVIGFALYAVRSARPDRPAAADGRFLAIGTVLPLVVITVMFVRSMAVSNEVKGVPSTPADLRIEVIGHQFWFEVRYPDHRVVTATEVHVPVGSEVELRVTSADVIHSFWIPQAQGKIDMIPGHRNAIRLRVDEPGTYRGICTEFCGVQHALMGLLLVAHPAEAFDAWILAQQRDTSADATSPGARHFERWCVECHAIRGAFPAGATGSPGPDLTHLATRRTLGSATLANNRGNLGGWILDPQPLKPGVRMPASPLSPAELHELLDYLESLR